MMHYCVDPNRPNAGDMIMTNRTVWIYDPARGWLDTRAVPDFSLVGEAR